VPAQTNQREAEDRGATRADDGQHDGELDEEDEGVLHDLRQRLGGVRRPERAQRGCQQEDVGGGHVGAGEGTQRPIPDQDDERGGDQQVVDRQAADDEQVQRRHHRAADDEQLGRGPPRSDGLRLEGERQAHRDLRA
jgi:hypothetical protein